MDKDQLMNFRSNIINGNKKDAREIMREYGENDFFFDYAQYLEILEFSDKQIELDELFQALANFKYIK